MAYIELVSIEQASGALKKVYDQAASRAGGVAQIIQVMSQTPTIVAQSMQFYVEIMRKENDLSFARKEMIATVTSNINDCYYWTLSHARDFGEVSGDKERAALLIFDYRTAGFDQPERALCDFAAKLTLVPGDMTEKDVNRLRDLGLTDAAISVATQACGYFNYINRIADALGVDSEAWMTPSKEEWLAKKRRDYLTTLNG